MNLNFSSLWTASQRRALLVLLIGLWLVLAGTWCLNRRFIDDAADTVPSRAEEMADRLDPNTADWQSLAAIPELGEKRAQAIIAYREKFMAQGRGPTAFRSINDLTRVKGIGASTASNIAPYLTLSETTPTSR